MKIKVKKDKLGFEPVSPKEKAKTKKNIVSSALFRPYHSF